VLLVVKEATSPQGGYTGGGGYDSVQSSQAHSGGGGYDSGHSNQAHGGGDGYESGQNSYTLRRW
jgi:hypothetical protein